LKREYGFVIEHSTPNEFVVDSQKEKRLTMTRLGRLAVCLMLVAVVCSAQDVVHLIHGTIKYVDSATKTVVVKTADGTEHTIKVTGDTVVKGTKDGFDGLKEGTEVVARTTGKGVTCI
jgi:hypothetical protein